MKSNHINDNNIAFANRGGGYYYNIRLYKLIALLVIMLLHYGQKYNAHFFCDANQAVFVEYFFIISGIFVAKDYYEKKYSFQKFFVRKVKSYMPDLWLFLILYFTMLYVGKRDAFYYWIGKRSFLSFLGLQILGVGDYAHNFGVTWYVSGLLVCGLLLYAVISIIGNHNKAAIIIPTIIVIAGYVRIFLLNNGQYRPKSIICDWDPSLGIISNLAFTRALCDMSVGIIIYHATRGKNRKTINSVVELICFATAFVLAYISNSYIAAWCSLALFIISIYNGMPISDHANESFHKLFSEKIPDVSYQAYLNHALFVDSGIMNVLFLVIGSQLLNELAYILAVFLFSFVSYTFVKSIKLFVNKTVVKVKA